MNLRIRALLSIAIVSLMIFSQPVFGENGFPNPLLNFDPSPEQMSALQEVFDECAYSLH